MASPGNWFPGLANCIGTLSFHREPEDGAEFCAQRKHYRRNLLSDLRSRRERDQTHVEPTGWQRVGRLYNVNTAGADVPCQRTHRVNVTSCPASMYSRSHQAQP